MFHLSHRLGPEIETAINNTSLQPLLPQGSKCFDGMLRSFPFELGVIAAAAPGSARRSENFNDDAERVLDTVKKIGVVQR